MVRLTNIAVGLIAICVAAVAATDDTTAAVPVARDFERKMEARDPRNHSKRGRAEKLITDGMLTWYGGGQLSNPACGGATPSKWDHVVAVKAGGMFKCHDTVHIHYNGKMVPAKVVDYCSGCAPHHIDLTQGTFEALAPLSVGVLHNIHIRLIPHN